MLAVVSAVSIGSLGQASSALASGVPHEPQLSHPLSIVQRTSPRISLANGNVNVLAIMVQFQTDQDSLTSGNGHFMLSNDTGLDAPPHDKGYFENHLLFLQNYFRKVSGGKLNISYTVLDSVITLPHTMKYYSPPKKGVTNPDNLGLLYQDAWHTADSIYGGSFDFSQYQCFVIFHAGAGRDIDFSTALGYDPLPYNLPSVYLNLASLQSMFDSPGYQGVVVDGGKFRIPNSIIMPESERYLVMDSPQDTVINLTLGSNGLLAASFGSFLGLPDLFDTQTGVTGIGRFGLMDGQAIFAYGGLFPPEPSAWEKTYLGWVTPVEVSPPTATQYTLYANETGKYSVLKVPVSGSEYFLIENRQRDAHQDGERITTYYQGSYHTTTIGLAYDTSYFDGTQISNINGVVTDADEFDWALPEPDYPPDRATFHGGILIWHIDQNVIDANLGSNTVNANPVHRGVAVMEAHGANEIGRLIADFTGQLYYYDGSAFDFWFKGNPIPSYGNAFTPNSLPNSDSYNGGNSHVYITNFSSSDSAMTFDVAVGDTTIKPTTGFPRNIFGATKNSSPVFGHIAPSGALQLLANNGDSLYAFNMDGTSILPDASGLFTPAGGRFQPIVSASNASQNAVYSMDDSALYGFSAGSGAVTRLFTVTGLASNGTLSLPLLGMGTKIVAFGSRPGFFSVFRTSGNYTGAYSVQSGTPALVYTSPSLAQYAAADTSVLYLNAGIGVYRVNLDNTSEELVSSIPSSSDSIIALLYSRLSPSASPCIISLSRSSVFIDSAMGNPQKVFTAFPGDTITSGPVVADLSGDGNRDIIFATQTKIYALSRSGAVLDGFPVSTIGSEALSPNANRITGSIAVADLDGDGKPEIIFGTEGGELYAYTGASAKLLPGFPLSVGDGLAGSPAVAYDSQTGLLYLAATGMDGYLYSWTFKGISADQVQWGSLLGSSYHSNSVVVPLQSQPGQPVATLMPASQVYNWPNPVTNGLTKIHFFLRDNARVSIGIYTFAGDKVADIQTNGVGGSANEVDWNAGGVQSGVYFARVEAVSSNERAVAIIKIAVVK